MLFIGMCPVLVESVKLNVSRTLGTYYQRLCDDTDVVVMREFKVGAGRTRSERSHTGRGWRWEIEGKWESELFIIGRRW
jgi:hypothetical protein